MTTEHEYDFNQEAAARRAAVETFIRFGIIGEAKASIALDKDPDCHTCHNECTEFEYCPGNQHELG
jgi:hypothetical protein